MPLRWIGCSLPQAHPQYVLTSPHPIHHHNIPTHPTDFQIIHWYYDDTPLQPHYGHFMYTLNRLELVCSIIDNGKPSLVLTDIGEVSLVLFVWHWLYGLVFALYQEIINELCSFVVNVYQLSSANLVLGGVFIWLLIPIFTTKSYFPSSRNLQKLKEQETQSTLLALKSKSP